MTNHIFSDVIQQMKAATDRQIGVIDADGREAVNVDASRVEFVVLSEEAISWYIATGEPMDKAGAYAVQGRAGMFVRSISGSYSNVIGLPMAMVREILKAAGADIP